MRKSKCPACHFEVPKAFIRKGTFHCPSCSTELRIPEIGRQVLGPLLLVGGVSTAFLVGHLIGLTGNSLLLAVVLLMAPCGFGIALLSGALLGALFPRLERNPGEDSAGILHIVPPSGPSKASGDRSSR